MKKACIGVYVVFGVSLAPACHGEAKLEYVFQKGDAYRTVVTHEQSMTLGVKGKPSATEKATTKKVDDWHVEAVRDDGTALITITTTDRVLLKDGSKKLQGTLKATIGTKLRAAIDRSGRVSSCKLEASPDFWAQPGSETADAMCASPSSNVGSLPSGQIRLGQRWSNTDDEEVPVPDGHGNILQMRLNHAEECTITSLSKLAASISCRVTSSGSAEGSFGMVVETTVVTDNTLDFDLALGRPIRKTARAESKSTTSLPDGTTIIGTGTDTKTTTFTAAKMP